MGTTKHSEAEAPKGFSRRRFLKVAGAGAAAIGASSGLAAIGGQSLLSPDVAHAATHPENFGRIFPSLPSFAPATDVVRAALMDIGKPGGILDANDNLAAGPVALIVDPALSANNRNNPTHTAGTTFMGQFLDHDMTFDTGSTLGVPTKPESATNARTPAFDLDSVYGRGPVADSQLYDPADRITHATDNLGRTVSYTYDSAGRLATVTDTNGGVKSYTYDSQNNLLTVTDARGIVTDRRAGRIETEKCEDLCALLSKKIKKIGDTDVLIKPGKGHRFVVVFRGKGLEGPLTDADPNREGVAIPTARTVDPDSPKDAVCKDCSDERKDKPVVGMTIIRNVKASADDKNVFEGGDILDLRDGPDRLVTAGQWCDVHGDTIVEGAQADPGQPVGDREQALPDGGDGHPEALGEGDQRAGVHREEGSGEPGEVLVAESDPGPWRSQHRGGHIEAEGGAEPLVRAQRGNPLPRLDLADHGAGDPALAGHLGLGPA